MWNNDDAYERFMGRWSRRLGDLLCARLLDAGAGRGRWLDVGCGPGSMIAAALDAGVERVDALDPSADFVEAVRERFDLAVVGARIGTAEDLGGFHGPYDAVVSSLVLNFTPDPVASLRSMRGALGAHDGIACAAVWDHTDERSFLARFWAAAEAVAGAPAAADERTASELTTADGLAAAGSAAGWTGAVEAIDVPCTFEDADDLWLPFLGGTGPAGAWLHGRPQADRDAVRERLLEDVAGDGWPVTLPARALVITTEA